MEPAAQLIGVGSPLVDLIVHVDDAVLATEVGGEKGGMEYWEADKIRALLDKLPQEPLLAPGGAAANTTAGVAALGVPSAFVGSAGSDAYGELFAESLQQRGCQSRLIPCDLPTGHVLSLVTPDAQRTMRTCLGAAVALSPERMNAALFAGAKVVMLEGYTLFNHDLTRAVAAAARAAGCQLALDLASFEVVEANRELLTTLLAESVDIVFANEDEARAWCGSGDPLTGLRALAEHCAVAVVKVGADGAWIRAEGEEHHVPAQTVAEVVDTTGAGDTWAAGFLAAYLRGAPVAECGQIGALAAAAVVQVSGALVPEAAWLPVRGRLDAWA